MLSGGIGLLVQSYMHNTSCSFNLIPIHPPKFGACYKNKKIMIWPSLLYQQLFKVTPLIWEKIMVKSIIDKESFSIEITTRWKQALGGRILFWWPSRSALLNSSCCIVDLAVAHYRKGTLFWWIICSSLTNGAQCSDDLAAPHYWRFNWPSPTCDGSCVTSGSYGGSYELSGEGSPKVSKGLGNLMNCHTRRSSKVFM